jgi:hypothetical protein
MARFLVPVLSAALAVAFDSAPCNRVTGVSMSEPIASLVRG